MPNEITAAELIKQLASNPEYIAREKQEEEARLVAMERYRVEQMPLREDLKAVRVSIDTIWDLVMRREPYPRAVPVLIKHLGLQYSDRTKEGIARSLAIPDARTYWPVLAKRYTRTDIGRGERAGLAAAVSATATDAVMGQLVELAKDSSNGTSRVLLLSALRKSRLEIARAALRDLADDPAVAKEIASWSRPDEE